VSGNGIGFVWHDAVWRTSAGRIGEAQDEEVVEGALAHEVEAGFIAVDGGDGGAAGETGQSIGQAVEAGSGGLGGKGLGTFVFEDYTTGQQSVAERGPGGTQLPLRGSGAAGEISVGARCANSS
jgi:hypothetical protein